MQIERNRLAWVAVLMLVLVGLAGRAADRTPEAFEEVFNKTPEEVKALVGEPDGRYFDGENEYWLYDVVVKETDGIKKCPELMFRKGKVSQANYLPQEIMAKSVAAAKSFADFEPAQEVATKKFLLKDTAVLGKKKAEVETALGRPDFKKVFNGKEVWVYKKVRLAADQEREFSVYIEFDGETCSGSVGA